MKVETLNKQGVKIYHLSADEVMGTNKEVFEAAFIYRPVPDIYGEIKYYVFKDRFHDAGLVNANQLQMRLEKTREHYKDRPEILVTITGPTGVGKTTLAKALFNAIDNLGLMGELQIKDGDYIKNLGEFHDKLEALRKSGVNIKIID